MDERDEVATLSMRAAALQHELELVQMRLRALAATHSDPDDHWEPETPVPRSPTEDGQLEAQRNRLALLQQARIDLASLDAEHLAYIARLIAELAHP